jgi:protein subunit release factor B
MRPDAIGFSREPICRDVSLRRDRSSGHGGGFVNDVRSGEYVTHGVSKVEVAR